MNSIGEHNARRRRSINFSKGGLRELKFAGMKYIIVSRTVSSLHRWERIVYVGDGKFMRF